MMPLQTKSIDRYRAYDGVHNEPGYHVQKFKCDECWITNCFECEQGACGCYCRDSSGIWTPKPEHGYDPTPQAGTGGRRKWIGRNSPLVINGEWHLHALFNRGTIRWTLTGKGSALCSQPGRCKRIRLELI